MKISNFTPTQRGGFSLPQLPQSSPTQNPGDHFQSGSFGLPNDLIPHLPRAEAKGQGDGAKDALRFVGIGVMLGGILASTQLPHGWVGVGMIGSMFAGAALMSLANQ